MSSYLSHHTVDWSTCCRMTHGVTRGLAFLHTELHRAAGPPPGDPDTMAISEVGTVRYMAPEVLGGALDLRDCASALKQVDVYALGLLYWESFRRCSQLFTGEAVPEHQLAFQAELGNHPSFQEMQILVNRNKFRPRFPESWRSSSPALSSLMETMEDCWDPDAEARLTAQCAEQRLCDLTLHSHRIGPPPDLGLVKNLHGDDFASSVVKTTTSGAEASGRNSITHTGGAVPRVCLQRTQEDLETSKLDPEQVDQNLNLSFDARVMEDHHPAELLNHQQNLPQRPTSLHLQNPDPASCRLKLGRHRSNLRQVETGVAKMNTVTVATATEHHQVTTVTKTSVAHGYSAGVPVLVVNSVVLMEDEENRTNLLNPSPDEHAPLLRRDPDLHQASETRSNVNNNNNRIQPQGLRPEPHLESQSSSKPEAHLESQSSSKPEPHLESQSSSIPEPNLESHSSSKPEPHLESQSSSKPEAHLEIQSSKPEPHLESQSSSKPEPHLESQSSSKPEAHLESQSSSKPEPHLESQSSSKPEPHLESQSSSKPEPHLESQSSKPEPHLESQSSSKPEPHLEKSQSSSKPEPHPESQSSSKPEPHLESQSSSKPEPHLESQSSSKPEPHLESQSSSKPEPHLESQSSSKPEAHLESQSSSKPEPHLESQSSSKPEPHLESQSSSKPEPHLESQSSKPEPHLESQSSSKPEPHLESQSSSKPEPHPESQSSSKPEPHLESQSSSKPEPHLESQSSSKPEPHLESQSSSKPEPHLESQSSSKPEPHLESQSSSKPEPHLESQSSSKPEPHLESQSSSKPEPHLESQSSSKPEPHLESQSSKPEPHLESQSSKPKPHLESQSSSKPEPPLESQSSKPEPHLEKSQSSKPEPHLESQSCKPEPHLESQSSKPEPHLDSELGPCVLTSLCIAPVLVPVCRDPDPGSAKPPGATSSSRARPSAAQNLDPAPGDPEPAAFGSLKDLESTEAPALEPAGLRERPWSLDLSSSGLLSDSSLKIKRRVKTPYTLKKWRPASWGVPSEATSCWEFSRQEQEASP
ncbi:hypothetical protein F7725_002706, partial [Dissostichus mawsoni]